MPLEYLREIANSQLPLEVSKQDDIDKLRVLVAAGMIIAKLPEVGKEGVGTVQEVTGFGRATLKAKGG